MAATLTRSQRTAKSKSQFQNAFDTLNEQQKRAVETIEGPVLCIAGPGTGKTQVIALRVAQILQKTQMRPSNILCLTFSVSGATEMRERLRSIIGPDAYSVTVKNFHSFCNDIIQEFPLVFEQWAAMEQISDVERYRLINSIVEKLLPDLSLVNPKNPFGRTKDILWRISQLKREGKTHGEDLSLVASHYRSILELKSKEGTKAHEQNVRKAKMFEEFLVVFQKYQEALERSGLYDYDDMILTVNEALHEHDWLLETLQIRYQYVLVDEFQDTNGAQYDLLTLLTSFATLDHDPNVFIVGDDDQAIYRFQGANMQNIMQFRDRFPEAPIITLTTSYRCTQPILDAAGSLISGNTERLVGTLPGISKDMVSGSETEGSPVPQLLFAPSDMTEMVMIADAIQERIEQGIAPGDIAVLVQKNSELSSLYDTLRSRDIPVVMSGKLDLLKNSVILELIAILKAVHTPGDSAVLASALSCSCFSVHPADLAEMFARKRREKVPLMDILLELDSEKAGPTLLALRDSASLIQARDTLLSLHQKIGVRTVIETVEKAMKETGLISPIRDGCADGAPPPVGRNTYSDLREGGDVLTFAVLQEFFDQLKNRAYEQPEFSFQTFLDDLSYYQESQYGELRLSYDLPHLSESGVNLMTAHQSKGLEFDTVILANFREGHWDRKRNPSALSVPEDLLFGWTRDSKSFEQNQDERRVAYVAMTRAKRELLFTCPRTLTTGDKSRDVSPSGFFAECGELPETHTEISDPVQAISLLQSPTVHLDEEYKAFLRERLKKYALSVTALNHFLADPQMFLEVDLLQVPQTKSTSLVYGNAVHEAVKQWGLSVQRGEPMNREQFVMSFKRYMNEREVLTKKERASLICLGEDALPRYFDTRLSGSTPTIYKIEFGITAFLGDIPIKGKLDRIDIGSPESSIARVIDYKTGRTKTEKQIRDDGDYFRQLAFYRLLLEQKNLPITAEEFVLDFIGEGSEYPVERSFSVTDSELENLKKVVKAVWAKITNLDFTPLGS